MFSAAEVGIILLIGASWIGALLLVMMLGYARREYGPHKGRTIGAILMETAMSFSVAIFLLASLPLVRLVDPDVKPDVQMVIRYVDVTICLLVVWVSVARMMLWALRGDGGQTTTARR
jgi:hypothetical protein